jgi:uncharacterized Zn finger protein
MYYEWRPYVSVAQRRQKALKEMNRLRKSGRDIQPIEIAGRKIATTYWGQAWCGHFEALGDYANRLPRGRTYVRNGSVCHLAIAQGEVIAKVSGSEIYNVVVKINVLPPKKWEQVKQACAGQIGSLLELLQGNISSSVMQVVTDRANGLFPLPAEIKYSCDCPDWAGMCKHIAAVLYGVGARLDHQPELLFTLRGVNHLDLITASADEAITKATSKGSRRQVAAADLGDVFGIELDASVDVPAGEKKRKPRTKQTPDLSVDQPSPEKRPQARKRSASKDMAVSEQKTVEKASAKATAKRAKARAADKQASLAVKSPPRVKASLSPTPPPSNARRKRAK